MVKSRVEVKRGWYRGDVLRWRLGITVGMGPRQRVFGLVRNQVRIVFVDGEIGEY